MNVFTQATLLESYRNCAWAIEQKIANQRKIWAKLPGSQEILFEINENADSLGKKVKNSNGQIVSIPENYWVWPTGFDLQTHLRFPGQATKETLAGGVSAGFSGGYDTLLTMPNTNPYLDSAELVKEAIKASGEEKNLLPVEILFTAAATVGMKGESATNIRELMEAGASAITDDGWGIKNDALMENIFAQCAQVNALFMQHAETPGHRGVASKSSFQINNGLPEYPRTAESSMVLRDLQLLKKNPRARYHVLHISTKETLDVVRQGKEQGLNITAEVTPHHLFFSNEDIPAPNMKNSTYFKMNPPLFSPEDRHALREALSSGLVDCVSTDHAPHEEHNKAQGWLKSPFGTRALEATVSVLVGLVKENIISEERAKEAFAYRPRAILGISGKPKGILCINPNHAYSLEELPGISKNSCFSGARLFGKIEWRAEGDVLYKHR